MNADELAKTLRETRAFVEKIRPILAGQGPMLQGAVLAQLTGTWLAGHPTELWARLIAFQSMMSLQMAQIITAESEQKGKVH